MRKMYSLKAHTIFSNTKATERGNKSSHHAAPVGSNAPRPAAIPLRPSRTRPTYTAPLEMGTATRLENRKLSGNW